MAKIVSFTDLNAWKEGHKLVVLVYKTTDVFPKKETYSLIDQMRRSAASITSNIAEGLVEKATKRSFSFTTFLKDHS